MFFYLGEEVHTVDSVTRKRKNKQRSWEYGYNEDIDTVIISRDGTLGPVFHVNGINIGLPNPRLRRHFTNYGRIVENQIWERDQKPEGLNATNWHLPKYKSFIDSQFHKREHGDWILLGGKPVWLCGSYWFFLQEYKEGSNYPSLRIIQNELMMFWEACKADQRCYGMNYVKNRRFGASALGNNELIYSGISNENKILGMLSKKGSDARKIFNRLVRAYKRLSPYFQVETDGTSTPKKELVFQEQNRRRRVGEMIDDDAGLNTVITWHNTELNAMDGEQIFRSMLDEAGKFPKEVPFDEYWAVVKTSHTIGMDIVGKAFVVSTVNSKSKGGQEFQNIWNQSDPLKRNANGQTESGLYRIFIDSALGLQGFYDRFGFSIVENPEKPIVNDRGRKIKIGADQYLKNKLASITDPVLLNEEIRQFPRKVADAFRDEAKDCAFNLTKIMEQIEYNEEELEDGKFGNRLVSRGNFSWKDGVKDSKVVWNPDPENGRFWIVDDCHPKEGNGNILVKKNRNGINSYTPLHIGFGAFGVDPFNRSITADGRGSNGAIHLFVKDNMLGYPSNSFILEYIARPKKIEIFYEDVIMAMVYFSFPILPEMSSDRFSQMLVDRGYRNFVLNNPLKRRNNLTPEEKRVGGVNAQNSQVREAQFQVVNSYIEDYIGVARDNSNRSRGEMGFMPFNRTLEQWKDVDPDDRTEFDAYISSSLALLGSQSRVKQLDNEEDKATIEIPFRRYDNKGIISKAL